MHLKDTGSTKEWSKQVFSKNLRRYMESSGKTQKEIAEIAGVTAPTFNEWIRGKKFPRIDKVQKLADYFGIKKSDLIEEKPPEEQQKKPDADEGLSDNMRELMDFVRTVPEDKAAMILSVIRTIVESGK